MSSRKVSATIPIEQIPYVMRAIGYYPSEQEVGCVVVCTHSCMKTCELQMFVCSG